MQAYDLLMLIVLAMATIFGAIKGFAWQVASLASVIVSYIVAYRFRFEVAEMIQAQPPWNLFLAMLILYVGTSFVIWVAFRLLSGMIDRVRLKEFDRHLGAAFGLAKGAIYCLLITMFAMSLLGQNQRRAICQSRSGYYISTALDRGVGILPKEIHDVVGPYLANLDNKLKTGQDGTAVPGTDPSGATNPLGNLGQNLGLPTIPDGVSDALQGMNLPGNINLPNGFGAAEGTRAGGPGTNQGLGQAVELLNGLQTAPPAGQSNGIFPPLGAQSAPASGGTGDTLRGFSNTLRPTGNNQAQQPRQVVPR